VRFSHLGNFGMKSVAIRHHRPPKRAADVWDSARFTGIFLASSFFYISNIIHARPPTRTAGKAYRWLASPKL
jgi:hypothetical protein